MHIDKVNWITAYHYDKPKWHSFSPSLSWKQENVKPRHCLAKCALENKLLNQNYLGIIFVRKLPHTLIPVIASTYCGSMLFRFYWATLYRLEVSQGNRNLIKITFQADAYKQYGTFEFWWLGRNNWSRKDNNILLLIMTFSL